MPELGFIFFSHLSQTVSSRLSCYFFLYSSAPPSTYSHHTQNHNQFTSQGAWARLSGCVTQTGSRASACTKHAVKLTATSLLLYNVRYPPAVKQDVLFFCLFIGPISGSDKVWSKSIFNYSPPQLCLCSLPPCADKELEPDWFSLSLSLTPSLPPSLAYFSPAPLWVSVRRDEVRLSKQGCFGGSPLCVPDCSVSCDLGAGVSVGSSGRT